MRDAARGDAAGELGRIVGRAAAHLCREDELTPGVADRGQLDEAAPPPATAGTHTEIVAFVLGIQSGGIDGGDGVLAEELSPFGDLHQGVQEALESPFFSKR